jgi:hypothetical protein
MKLALACAIILATASTASAQYYGSRNNSFGGYGTGSNPSSTYHQGYTTNSGTYVQPHYQTSPNNTQYDNYGTSGNYNPHTGTYGTRTPRW